MTRVHLKREVRVGSESKVALYLRAERYLIGKYEQLQYYCTIASRDTT